MIIFEIFMMDTGSLQLFENLENEPLDLEILKKVEFKKNILQCHFYMNED